MGTCSSKICARHLSVATTSCSSSTRATFAKLLKQILSFAAINLILRFVKYANVNLEEAAFPLPLLLDLLHLLQHQFHLTVCLHSVMMAVMTTLRGMYKRLLLLPVVPVVHDCWFSYLAIRNLIYLILICFGIRFIKRTVPLQNKQCF